MLKVLVIDDDRSIVQVLRVAFQQKGSKVFAAADPVQGVRLAIEERPDVILLDLQMPAGGGSVAMRALSRNVLTHLIPIICISALQGDEVREACLAAGSQAFFSKPFSPSEVVAKAFELAGHPLPAEPGRPAGPPEGVGGASGASPT